MASGIYVMFNADGSGMIMDGMSYKSSMNVYVFTWEIAGTWDGITYLTIETVGEDLIGMCKGSGAPDEEGAFAFMVYGGFVNEDGTELYMSGNFDGEYAEWTFD